jgi:hypothetical protein
MKITLRKLLYKAQWSWLWFVLYLNVPKTLITVLRGWIFLIVVSLLAIFLKEKWRIAAWIGFPMVFITLSLIIWAFLLGRLLLFVPFPSCRKGKCHGIDDYSWFHGTFFGKCRWGLYWYKCHCGDQYLRRGKKFMEFIPEPKDPPSPWIDIRKGTTRPYKKLIGFRKWADDTEPN